MICDGFSLLYVCKHIVSISLLNRKFAAKKALSRKHISDLVFPLQRNVDAWS